MKIFVALFISLFAVSAMSCPNLNGTYQCEKDPENSNDTGVITVETIEGGYSILDEDTNDLSYMPADNKVYNVDGGTYQGWCKGNAHYAKMTGTDQSYGPFVINMTTSLKAGNFNQSGKINVDLGEGKKDYPFNTTCKRL